MSTADSLAVVITQNRELAQKVSSLHHDLVLIQETQRSVGGQMARILGLLDALADELSALKEQRRIELAAVDLITFD